jgi:opacity protein-like surface antigen
VELAKACPNMGQLNNKGEYMKKLLMVSGVLTMLSAGTAYAGGGHEGYNTSNNNYVNNNADANNNNYSASNWYLTVSGLGNFLQDQDLTVGATPGSASFSNGWGALVAVGHQIEFQPLVGFRGELEVGYRKADVDSFSGGGSSGSLNAGSVMANVYYDFVNQSRFKPYIGGGIGAARIDARNIGTATGTLDDKGNAFAYQGIAGVSTAINKSWDVQLEYRYFATNDADLTTSTGARTNVDYDGSNVVLGLKYNFN